MMVNDEQEMWASPISVCTTYSSFQVFHNCLCFCFVVFLYFCIFVVLSFWKARWEVRCQFEYARPIPFPSLSLPRQDAGMRRRLLHIKCIFVSLIFVYFMYFCIFQSRDVVSRQDGGMLQQLHIKCICGKITESVISNTDTLNATVAIVANLYENLHFRFKVWYWQNIYGS